MAQEFDLIEIGSNGEGLDLLFAHSLGNDPDPSNPNKEDGDGEGSKTNALEKRAGGGSKKEEKLSFKDFLDSGTAIVTSIFKSKEAQANAKIQAWKERQQENAKLEDLQNLQEEASGGGYERLNSKPKSDFMTKNWPWVALGGVVFIGGTVYLVTNIKQ